MNPKEPDRRLRTPLEGSGHRPWEPQAVIAAPLQLHQTPVLPEWVDYNGHMSESCYLLAFGDSTDAFFRFVGIDETYRDVGGHSFYTVETHLHNLREVALAAPLRLSLQLLDMDDKRVHLFHAMQHGDTGELLATAEQMLVHVNMQQGRAAPILPTIHQHLQSVFLAHAVLPRPAQAGSSVGIRRKPVRP